MIVTIYDCHDHCVPRTDTTCQYNYTLYIQQHADDNLLGFQGLITTLSFSVNPMKLYNTNACD